MGADDQPEVPGTELRSSHHRAARAALLLVLMSLVLMAAAPVAADNAGVLHGETAVSVIGYAGTVDTVAVPSAAVFTVRPTMIPARLNRTFLIQTVKNIADRPRVTIPSGLFFLIVAIAFIGLFAILYLLLWGGRGRPAVQKRPGSPDTGCVTVVGEPAAPGPVLTPDNGYHGPAVLFPPSLGKRFLHPEFVGQGGLARVFRAQDAKTGMTVAVKVPVRFDEVTGTHFTKDIALWQGLIHPNIIRIYSSNILPVPYIEMEYAPSSLAGIPLPLPEEKAVAMVLGIARGLAYAHDRGVVHRDIKPENILLSADGTPKITDWGLGKAIGDPRQSSVIGFSPAYAAPEQLAPHAFGRPGQATDIYQLGMLLVELLTGTPAFRGEGMHDLNLAILEGAPAVPSWSGRHERELRGIILRCLAKKPEERYKSVADLIRDLEAVL
jgi:Protein kinase domain